MERAGEKVEDRTNDGHGVHTTEGQRNKEKQRGKNINK